MVPTLNYGSSTLETVGSVRRGRQVWVLARIRDKETTIGDADEIARYILLSNSHDGFSSGKDEVHPCKGCLQQHPLHGPRIRGKHIAADKAHLRALREP